MNTSTRNLLIAAAVILVVICLCLVALSLGGAFFWLRGAQTSSPVPSTPQGPAVTVPLTPEDTPLSTTSPAPTATETSAPAAQPTDSVSESAELPRDILESMLLIEQQVVRLRGLQPDSSSYNRTLLTPQQLRERVENEFLQDYTAEEARRDAVVLSLFGLLEPDFDLISLYTELFSEQIAGYYDDQAKEMVVVQGRGFGGPEKITYAHEYVHALQDQNYDLRNGLGYDDELCEQDTERCAALQALLEGDATLTELNWLFNHATIQDREELAAFYNELQTPVFQDAPAYLQEDFLFPYLHGQTFVQNFWTQGQAQSLAALYQNPPVSTEQILHPEKYPQDVPVPVELPDLAALLGDGWQEIDRNVMGQWYTYLVLSRGSSPSYRIADEQAFAAAEGWGGDSYVIYQQSQSEAQVLLWRQSWDTPQDANEFFQTFLEYANLRYQMDPQQPEPGAYLWEMTDAVHQLILDETSASTLWITAPDPELAGLILDALEIP